MAIAALRAVTKSGRNIDLSSGIAANIRLGRPRAGNLHLTTVSAQTEQATRVEAELRQKFDPAGVCAQLGTQLTKSSPGATVFGIALAHPRASSPFSGPNTLIPVTEFSTEAPATNDSWDGILANLRLRYPGQKDSVLFCLYKLHSNPQLGLPDFRDEARLHGIPMAGRALHSAKVILGLATVKPRAPKAPKPSAKATMPLEPSRTMRTRRVGKDRSTNDGSIENKVLDAVRQIQSAAGAEAEKLRTAVREAVAILQRALDE